MAPPRVTIITPTYNQGRFIGDCISSVLAQGFQDWEQIVIDDGSTDDTAKVVAGFQDERIRYVCQPNVGILRLAETYNKALAMARGEFVAILEGDDLWRPDALSTLVAAMRPGVVLAYGMAQPMRDGRPLGPTIPSERGRAWLGPALSNEPTGTALLAMAHFNGRTFTFPCAVLLRRQTLAAIGGFQQPPGLPFVDLPTFMEVAAQGPFAFVPHVVALWRIHPASATRNRDELAIHGLLAAHAAATLQRHKVRLKLADEGIQDALRSWPAAIEPVRYEQAKAHLAARRWAAARKDFWRVVAGGPWGLRWRACVGVALAALRLRWPRS